MISDDIIEKAFDNTNFGPMSKRDLVRYGLLKVACGYYNGHTLKRILIDMALVNEKSLTLTKSGKEYLYDAFSNGTSV